MKITNALCVTAALLLLSGCATPKTAAPADDALIGSWALTHQVSEGSLKPLAPGVKAPTLDFTPEGSLFGFTAVNRLTSVFTVEPPALTIRPAGVTRMLALSSESADAENSFLTNLSAVALYEISGGTLTLKDKGGKAVLVFRSAS